MSASAVFLLSSEREVSAGAFLKSAPSLVGTLKNGMRNSCRCVNVACTVAHFTEARSLPDSERLPVKNGERRRSYKRKTGRKD